MSKYIKALIAVALIFLGIWLISLGAVAQEVKEYQETTIEYKTIKNHNPQLTTEGIQ